MGDRTVRWPLNVQGRAALGQKGSELTSLNAADLMIIGTHSECGNSAAGTEFL